MAVETASFPADLNVALPANGDGLLEGDNHIRLIKQVIVNTLPNVTAAITKTAAQINNLIETSVSLVALKALTPAANKFAYFTDATTAALSDLTAFGRSLVAAADAAAVRTLLGLGTLATKSSVVTADIGDDQVTFPKFQNINTAKLLGRTTASAGNVEEIGVGTGLTLAGGTLSASGGVRILQRLRQQSSTPGTLASNLIPSDNTVPQSTEGAQAFSQAITPQSASSVIRISGVLNIGCGTASSNLIVALFKGTTCVAVYTSDNPSSSNDQVAFDYEEASGDTSARTYSIRFGTVGGNSALNNDGGSGGNYGSKVTSTFLVEELL